MENLKQNKTSNSEEPLCLDTIVDLFSNSSTGNLKCKIDENIFTELKTIALSCIHKLFKVGVNDPFEKWGLVCVKFFSLFN